jgi:hypothetical protein
MRFLRRCRLCGGPIYRKVHLDESMSWAHVYEDTRHAAVLKRWWQL